MKNAFVRTMPLFCAAEFHCQQFEANMAKIIFGDTPRYKTEVHVCLSNRSTATLEVSQTR